MSDGPSYELISQEGEKFVVNSEVANLSGLVQTMIDNDAPEDEAQEIPLQSVKTATLAKVIEFCNHYIEEPMKEISTPIKSNDMAKIVEEWYASFVNIEKVDLYDLILAANYMDIKPLLDLSCCTIAAMIKGKTPEEIAAHFECTREFIPCDEAKVREENKWVEEI